MFDTYRRKDNPSWREQGWISPYTPAPLNENPILAAQRLAALDDSRRNESLALQAQIRELNPNLQAENDARARTQLQYDADQAFAAKQAVEAKWGGASLKNHVTGAVRTWDYNLDYGKDLSGYSLLDIQTDPAITARIKALQAESPGLGYERPSYTGWGTDENGISYDELGRPVTNWFDSASRDFRIEHDDSGNISWYIPSTTNGEDLIKTYVTSPLSSKGPSWVQSDMDGESGSFYVTRNPDIYQDVDNKYKYFDSYEPNDLNWNGRDQPNIAIGRFGSVHGDYDLSTNLTPQAGDLAVGTAGYYRKTGTGRSGGDYTWIPAKTYEQFLAENTSLSTQGEYIPSLGYFPSASSQEYLKQYGRQGVAGKGAMVPMRYANEGRDQLLVNAGLIDALPSAPQGDWWDRNDEWLAPLIFSVATAGIGSPGVGAALSATAAAGRSAGEGGNFGDILTAAAVSGGSSYLGRQMLDFAAPAITSAGEGLANAVVDAGLTASPTVASGIQNVVEGVGRGVVGSTVGQGLNVAAGGDFNLEALGTAALSSGASSIANSILGSFGNADSLYAEDFAKSGLGPTYIGPDNPTTYTGFDSAGDFVGDGGGYNSLGEFVGYTLPPPVDLNQLLQGNTFLDVTGTGDVASLSGNGSQYPINTSVPLSLNPIDANGQAHTGLMVDPALNPSFSDAYTPVTINATPNPPTLDYTPTATTDNSIKIPRSQSGGNSGRSTGGNSTSTWSPGINFTPYPEYAWQQYKPLASYEEIVAGMQRPAERIMAEDDYRQGRMFNWSDYA